MFFIIILTRHQFSSILTTNCCPQTQVIGQKCQCGISQLSLACSLSLSLFLFIFFYTWPLSLKLLWTQQRRVGVPSVAVSNSTRWEGRGSLRETLCGSEVTGAPAVWSVVCLTGRLTLTRWELLSALWGRGGEGRRVAAVCLRCTTKTHRETAAAEQVRVATVVAGWFWCGSSSSKQWSMRVAPYVFCKRVCLRSIHLKWESGVLRRPNNAHSRERTPPPPSPCASLPLSWARRALASVRNYTRTQGHWTLDESQLSPLTPKVIGRCLSAPSFDSGTTPNVSLGDPWWWDLESHSCSSEHLSEMTARKGKDYTTLS